MIQRIITLCYRKIIDINSNGNWEKLVFEDTYTEFRMQSQLFNTGKKYQSFAQLIQEVPGAEKLHYLVSPACIGYLQQLNEKIPDIHNSLGQICLRFKSFRFELINSDLNRKDVHQVAINFYSEPLLWHDTIGNQLLLSSEKAALSQLTDLLPMVPFLSIYSLNKAS